jgi:hypothetical protein
MSQQRMNFTLDQRMIIRAVRQAAYAAAMLELRRFRASMRHAQAAAAYLGCALLAKTLTWTGVPAAALDHADASSWDRAAFERVTEIVN